MRILQIFFKTIYNSYRLPQQYAMIVPWREFVPENPVTDGDIKPQCGVTDSRPVFTYKQVSTVINCISWDTGVLNVWSGCLHWAHRQPCDPCTQWITEIKTHVCTAKSNGALIFSNALTWTWCMATDAQAKFAVATWNTGLAKDAVNVSSAFSELHKYLK